jgi:hypothetical protein
MARMGDGTHLRVTMSSYRDEVPLAFGGDRNLLHFLIHRAIDNENPLVRLDSVSEYLREMGMEDSGQNRREVAERMERVSSLMIVVERFNNLRDMRPEYDKAFFLIDERWLPAAWKPKTAGVKVSGDPPRSDVHEYGLMFSQQFFAEMMLNPVSFPMELLRITSKMPMIQDLTVAITYRCISCHNESLIPWESVMDQCWQGPRDINVVKKAFRKAIKVVQGVYPDLMARVEMGGLRIVPPTSDKFLKTCGNAVKLLSRKVQA